MRRDPKHAEELDMKLKEQLVERSKNFNLLTQDQLESQFNATTPSESVTILYGSETGNAEEQAKSLWADVKARGLNATLSNLNDFEFEDLPKQVRCLVSCVRTRVYYSCCISCVKASMLALMH
jgi:sulfite reductase alpha subunit-like flavoprotein